MEAPATADVTRVPESTPAVTTSVANVPVVAVAGTSDQQQKRKPHDWPDVGVELAAEYFGVTYRRMTTLLRREDWRVNHKRVKRIWRKLGLKVPQKQPKRDRLWLCDGSTRRLRPEHKDHVWSYDFIYDRTREGRPIKS